MCKWVNKLPHTHTQAIPGLTLDSALGYLQDGTLKIKPYTVILLHLGTNNVWKDHPDSFRNKLIAIIDFVRKNSEVKRIGLSSILPRVRDVNYPDIEIKLTILNSLQEIVKGHKLYFDYNPCYISLILTV
jgi:hypothetical protein